MKEGLRIGLNCGMKSMHVGLYNIENVSMMPLMLFGMQVISIFSYITSDIGKYWRTYLEILS